jgi:hypothetical protein
MFTNGFVQPQQMMELWARMTQEHVARMDQMATELQKAQAQAAERAALAIDESARLMKETMTYATQLSAEWRKITLEATKKAAEMATPKA